MHLIVKKKDKLAYLSMHKVASSSIPRTFFSSQAEIEHYEEEIRKITNKTNKISGWHIILSTARPPEAPAHLIFNLPAFASFSYAGGRAKGWQVNGYDNKTQSHQTRSIGVKELQSYFTFTFVRNPFARLVSFFQNKLFYDEGKKLYCSMSHDKENNFALKGFSDLIEQLAKQKNQKMDMHFRPQVCLLNDFRQAGGKMNFIGKIENMEKDFEVLRAKYDLLPLERLNNSVKQNVLHKNWRDYYTPELAKLVFDRWHADFVELGYESEYPLLLTHLKTPVPLGWRIRGKRLLTHLKMKVQPLLIARWRKRQFFVKLGLPTYKRYLP